MQMLKELNLHKFSEVLASRSPAPGGGSVAALAGNLSASLLSMYCRLSDSAEKYPRDFTLMEKTGEEARSIAAAMLEAVDLDTAAFNKVMDAFRLPKNTPEEKSVRKQAIQKSTEEAARVPLETAGGCLRLLELVAAVAGKGNPGAVTDLGVANLQAMAGLEGAVYNVKINLASLKDAEIREKFSRDIGGLLEKGRKLWDDNRRSIEEDI